MCACVCTWFVYVHVCTYVHVYIIYVYVCAYVHVPVCICGYVYVHEFVCVGVLVFVRMCVSLCVCVLNTCFFQALSQPLSMDSLLHQKASVRGVLLLTPFYK